MVYDLFFYKFVSFATSERKKHDVHLGLRRYSVPVGETLLGKHARKSILFSYMIHGKPTSIFGLGELKS